MDPAKMAYLHGLRANTVSLVSTLIKYVPIHKQDKTGRARKITDVKTDFISMCC